MIDSQRRRTLPLVAPSETVLLTCLLCITTGQSATCLSAPLPFRDFRRRCRRGRHALYGFDHERPTGKGVSHKGPRSKGSVWTAQIVAFSELWAH